MASRVMSSWVGPSPPQQITASLRASAWRMAATMRAWLSPTLTWKYESMPGQGQLFSDPCRVGVDHLAEQQFRADGDDFAAHRRSPPAVLGRREVVELRRVARGVGRPPAVEQVLGPADQGQHHRRPTARSARCVVVEPVTGNRISPTARSWAAVLILASRPAGTDTPSGHARAVGADGELPPGDEDHRDPRPARWRPGGHGAEHEILSASGSRKAPEVVAPCRRASQPSRKSVQARRPRRGPPTTRPPGAR